MVCAKRAYNRFMEEALLNPDEKENPDELLAEIEKVLHADGTDNSEADKRIDSMSKDQLNEILQIARILGKQQKQKKRKKRKEETEEENGQQDDGNIMTAEEEQQEIEEEKEKITVQQ
jgi:hypothetical protein